LILFLDDLQWADDASISLFFHLGRRVEDSRVMLVGAYRPSDVALGRGGERHPLEPVINELTRYYGDIVVDLDQIPPERSRRFVDALLDSEPNCFKDIFREALFHRTGGHALFTVELLRALEDRGDLVRDDTGCWVPSPALDWETLPARVEGVIEERIDRLDDDLKEMLTVGSVEGEAFTAEVVAQVQALPERDAVRQLSVELERQHRLVSAEGLVRLGNLRLSLYRFVHNLFQHYLYNNLGEAERAYLHRDVGRVIEALFAGQTEEVAAQLARHFEEAGVPDKAVAYRLQAGTKALRMSAHREAIFHLNSGLERLADLPSGPERTQLELGLQNALGVASLATFGYASSQVQQAFTRARELAQALGDPAREVAVLYGLCVFRFVRGELNQAYEEGQQLLDLARQSGQVGYALGSLLALGAIALNLGKLEPAREHLETAIEQYDLEQHRDLAYALGQDPAVGSYAFLSFVLWHQGYPEQAIAAKDAGLCLAAELNHPYSHGMAASFAAMLLHMLRLRAECEAQAAAALQISKGHYPMWESIARFTHGWSITGGDRAQKGIREVQQGVDLWESTGAHLAFPYRHALLADACLAVGERGEGLQAIDESFTYPEEVWWLAEQHRLRAELLLLEPGFEAEAEADLRQALSIARDQGSKAFELRAALSLARLLRAQGRPAEGRAPLAECSAWFGEGLELPDLVDARTLLVKLAEES
jgi:tetratricopeptide (TPR) repeat protein